MSTSALPLISVIMPCYNSERYLVEAVESVLGQTYRNLELIVVDDGSTDRSPELIHGYGSRIRALTQENRGPYPARNAALRVAAGEFVAFLDADDWWSPFCLERLHRALERSEDAAIAYCGWQNVGATNRSNEPFIPRDYEDANKVELLLQGGSPWPIHAALTRRSVFDASGGFRETLPTSMDYDFWLRAGAAHRVVLVPEVLAFYRFHPSGQISSQPWKQAINGWRIKRQFLYTHPDLATGIGASRQRELVEGDLLKCGYQFFWQRNLVAARRVFRQSLAAGGWHLVDLKYLLPALLPERAYNRLVAFIDRRAKAG